MIPLSEAACSSSALSLFCFSLNTSQHVSQYMPFLVVTCPSHPLKWELCRAGVSPVLCLQRLGWCVYHVEGDEWTLLGGCRKLAGGE